MSRLDGLTALSDSAVNRFRVVVQLRPDVAPHWFRGERSSHARDVPGGLGRRQPGLRRRSGMSRPVRPTLTDVAARAGVSLKTASRALNGEYGVAESTAERVHEAARELGFRLNRLARGLASH